MRTCRLYLLPVTWTCVLLAGDEGMREGGGKLLVDACETFPSQGWA